MQKIATSGASASTPAAQEQRVRLVLEAEVFQDPDGGPDSLIATTDKLACEPMSPARLLGMVAEARAQLDQMERIAREFEARGTLAAIVAEHHLHVEEWDIANLDEKFRGKFVAFAALTTDGQRIVVVPKGQDPIERLAGVTELVRDMEATA